ncbi:MAG: hypothetical protein JO329_12910 [Planctomycetaceae bacterium]|nr:hypothetical protein [Planctomycetaceae bacterium]MBV8267989.1 hypothetical protein [Planctomycetaceae bacterium]MBV8383769.1 hypothetical protein [Planctomycetaceae bacterium]MBV8607414.1 hypothetical protein [Singulisphaera sp.]
MLEESHRRQNRLATIEAAMWRLKAEAMADAEWQRRAKADAERQCRGKTRRGREHGPIAEPPADKAQTNFTDTEVSVRSTANRG